MDGKMENREEYIIAIISDFAKAHSITPMQAYWYLARFKGLDFIDKFYEVNHRFPSGNVIEDLTSYCHRKGGALVYSVKNDDMGDDELKQAIMDSLQVKVGDWTFGDGGFGQITQIWPDFYEEYDNHIPVGKVVGDYKDHCYRIIKYFCTEDKVRRNGTGYEWTTPNNTPIVEGNKYGYWDLIQKHIKENPKQYLAYQKYKPKVLEGHIHVGYNAGPRWGKPEHTKEFYIELFDKIRKDLPERFTFVDLMDIAQKHQCPLRLDNPTPYGCVETMSIILFYNQGEYRGRRKLFCGLGKHLSFGRYFYEAPVIPTFEEVVKELNSQNK